MNVFLYTSEHYDTGQSLRHLLQQEIKTQSLALFSTLTELTSDLGRALKNNDIVILAIETPEELNELVTFRALLEDIRLILLLENEDDQTIAQAHRLRPRFICTGDIDVNQVVAVLQKMRGLNSNENRQHTSGGLATVNFC